MTSSADASPTADRVGAELEPGDVAPEDRGAIEVGSTEVGLSDVLRDGFAADGPRGDTAALDSVGTDGDVLDCPRPDTADQAWLVDYACRAPLVIDTCGLTEMLHQFTLLVRLDSAALVCGEQTLDDLDVTFTAPDGTHLPWEREDNPTGAEKLYWVKVPEIAPPPAAALLWVYLGNAANPPTYSPYQVWHALHLGVWHLDGVDERGVVGESTTSGLLAEAQGDMTTDVVSQGRVGRAIEFDGVDDWLRIGDVAPLNIGTSSFTLSLWVNLPQLPSQTGVAWSKGGFALGTPGYILELVSGAWRAAISDGVTTAEVALGAADEGVERWVSLGVVADRERQELRSYVDGEPGDVATLVGVGTISSSFIAAIGAQGNGAGTLAGRIDEVRFEAVARTDDWMRSQFRSIDGTLVEVGPLETRP